MDNLVPLLWFIFIVIWIISALAKKKARPGREEYEEEGTSPDRSILSPTPQETLEGFLRRLAGQEEEPKPVPVPEIKPVVEIAQVPPPVEVLSPTEVEELPLGVEVPTREKIGEIKGPLVKLADLGTLRQGIILSEILAPPRAQRPF